MRTFLLLVSLIGSLAFASDSSNEADRQQLEIINGMLASIPKTSPRYLTLLKRKVEIEEILKFREEQKVAREKAAGRNSPPKRDTQEWKLYAIKNGRNFYAEAAKFDPATKTIRTRSGVTFKSGTFSAAKDERAQRYVLVNVSKSFFGKPETRAAEVLAEFEDGSVATVPEIGAGKYQVWPNGQFIRQKKSDDSIAGEIVIATYPDNRGGFYLQGEFVSAEFADGSIAIDEAILENGRFAGLKIKRSNEFARPVKGKGEFNGKMVAIPIKDAYGREPWWTAANVIAEGEGGFVAVGLELKDKKYLAFHRSEIKLPVKSPFEGMWAGVRLTNGKIVGRQIKKVFADKSVAFEKSFGASTYEVFQPSQIIWPEPSAKVFKVVIEMRDQVEPYTTTIDVLEALANGIVVINYEDQGGKMTLDRELYKPFDPNGALANYVYWVKDKDKTKKVFVTAMYPNGDLRTDDGERVPKGSYLTVVNRKPEMVVFSLGRMDWVFAEKILSDGSIISNHERLKPNSYLRESPDRVKPEKIWYKTGFFSGVKEEGVKGILEDGSVITDSGQRVTTYLTYKPSISDWLFFSARSKADMNCEGHLE